LGWLSLLPAKLRATFDYTAAASEHLAAAGALSDSAKTVLEYAEFAFQRIGFALVLVGSWGAARFMNPQLLERRIGGVEGKIILLLVAALGAFGFAGLSASLGWFSVVLLASVSGPFLLRTGPGLAAASVALTALVHGVFFGAGRYSLPLILWTAPLCAVGVALVMQVVPPSSSGDSSPNSTIGRRFLTPPRRPSDN
jgi:hypothetical protein